MSSVLVTGGHGFIGSRIVAYLRAHGVRVYAAGRTARGGTDDVAFDIHDPHATEARLAELRPDVLVHAAWITEHGVFWDSLENAQWVESSIGLIRAFLQYGGRRVVGLGTCAEYAWNGRPLNEETSPLHPVSTYGAAKLALATLAEPWLSKSGASFAWGRVFHIYGPGEDPRKFVSAAIAASRRGTPIVARDPDRKLDYVHVDDVARAFALLATSDAHGAFNIGTGRGTRIGDALADVERAFGHETETDARARGIEPDIIADVTRAKRELGWQAEISAAAGIANMVTGSTPKGILT